MKLEMFKYNKQKFMLLPEDNFIIRKEFWKKCYYDLKAYKKSKISDFRPITSGSVFGLVATGSKGGPGTATDGVEAAPEEGPLHT